MDRERIDVPNLLAKLQQVTAIVRDLAASEMDDIVDGCSENGLATCAICGGIQDIVGSPGCQYWSSIDHPNEHQPNCAWQRAREWVAANRGDDGGP